LFFLYFKDNLENSLQKIPSPTEGKKPESQNTLFLRIF